MNLTSVPIWPTTVMLYPDFSQVSIIYLFIYRGTGITPLAQTTYGSIAIPNELHTSVTFTANYYYL